MPLDHCILDRMEPLRRFEIFNRDDFGAIRLTQKQNASIHRLINKATMALARKNDRASAAITFRTAFFGSG